MYEKIIYGLLVSGFASAQIVDVRLGETPSGLKYQMQEITKEVSACVMDHVGGKDVGIVMDVFNAVNISYMLALRKSVEHYPKIAASIDEHFYRLIQQDKKRYGEIAK